MTERRMTKHDGDCSIYTPLVEVNEGGIKRLIQRNPEDGICTCGYAHQQRFSNGYSPLMYSQQIVEILKAEARARELGRARG